MKISLVPTRVPHDVISEVLLSRKAFGTDFTFERGIICVRSHMIGQVFLACVLLAANLRTK